MNKREEELLNKYLDAEISAEELDELKSLMELNPELKLHISANNFIESNLPDFKTKGLPSDFTERVMNEISSLRTPVKSFSDKRFFVLMGIFFLVIIAGTILASLFLSGGESAAGFSLNLISAPKFDLTPLLHKIDSFFDSYNYRTLYLSLTLLLIATWGMLWNSYKNFKKGMNL